MPLRVPWICSLLLLVSAPPLRGSETDTPAGYYREPALSGNKLVFVAEGDLFCVELSGGIASRLTTHPGEETNPTFSPDGRTLAFEASYEGPTEIYTMPFTGGRPVRRTFDAASCRIACFTPEGHLVYATTTYSGLPDHQLVILDLENGARRRIPLSQAYQAALDRDGTTLFFTRLRRQSSQTKRYRGGTAENLWRFTLGKGEEATPLTADHPGTDSSPLFGNGRLFFLSDRDGSMNLWSMTPLGADPTQHTFHQSFDAQSPTLSGKSIVYQHGADLLHHDLDRGESRVIPIRLRSDFDHTREHWIQKPIDYLTAAHLSPDGTEVVLTARGQVFVVPEKKKSGRLVEASRKSGVRYRDARFQPGGDQLLVLSDESGEVELWTLPASGVGDRKQLTQDGKVLRWEAVPSPDGRWIAHHDKDWELWILDTKDERQTRVDRSVGSRFQDLAWSPDSRWLAYATTVSNTHSVIRIYGIEAGEVRDVTTDRTNSYSPAWHPNGKWLYFLSDRHFRSLVSAPWGTLQPEPFFDQRTNLYEVALVPGLRSPFLPADELLAKTDRNEERDEKKDEKSSSSSPEEKADKPSKKKSSDDRPDPVVIDFQGLADRTSKIPAPPGDYSSLNATAKRLLYVARPQLRDRSRDLVILPIESAPKPKTLVSKIRNYELSLNGKKLLVRKEDRIHLISSSSSAPAKLEKTSLNLSKWTFSLDPREEWEQMFVEAWRLERDYFYDRNMHGVDWPAMLDKYRPLVHRVRDRSELSDLIAQMVAELSALHIFVRGGDLRRGKEDIKPGALGARFERDPERGGDRIEHIYRSDPDRPELRAPLAQPHLDIGVGDIIVEINGTPVLDTPDHALLLRNRAGEQVRMRIRDGETNEDREVVVVPLNRRAEANLRYHEWEYTRRLKVEALSDGQIGYVHLRAMGSSDIAQWAREFYPVFNKKGLIVDVRHNRGGNIDSWILEKLMRKAWFYWQGRTGEPFWNMQYAFRGHMVTLCDERTASDGEAFSEGFRRLGLGPVIGMRTWGGEIWLSGSNLLVDRGVATSAEWGVYGPEGEWLIEGHGVDPDVIVDNPPFATFSGSDAQLEAGVRHLLKRISEDPVRVPPPPAGPDKSGR